MLAHMSVNIVFRLAIFFVCFTNSSHVRNVDKELSRMTYVHNFGILLWVDQALRNLHYLAAVKPSGKISPFN